MSDFAPGDLVVRVSGDPAFMPIGTTLRVDDLCPWTHPEIEHPCRGLLFGAYGDESEEYCECFHPENFRKIDKADEGFSTWMKSLQPKEETREPSIAPAIADGRRMAETPLGGSGWSPTSGGAEGNRPTLPALDPIETHPITPTFTLYTNPDLVKAIWEGSVE